MIYRWVDGALLVDLWPELDLPDHVRDTWQPLVDAARQGPTEDTMRVSSEDPDTPVEALHERIAARRVEAAQRLDQRDA